MNRTLLLAVAAIAGAQGASPYHKQHVSFKSGELTLAGYLFKPEGPGPFPAVLWNHGSEPNPGGGPQFDSVAAIFVPAGYAVFAPMRRGHSDSQGEYIVDSTNAETKRHGFVASRALAAHLLETEQLDDQLAGLTFLKQQAFVDTTRLIVAGCSYGGIQTLLGAERNVGYRAAVPISPAALSWSTSPELQQRLQQAAGRITLPVFLIQPPRDASLEPAHVLGPLLEKANPRSRTEVYPVDGPDDQQGHCFGGARGMHRWANDVLTFLHDILGTP